MRTGFRPPSEASEHHDFLHLSKSRNWKFTSFKKRFVSLFISEIILRVCRQAVRKGLWLGSPCFSQMASSCKSRRFFSQTLQWNLELGFARSAPNSKTPVSVAIQENKRIMDHQHPTKPGEERLNNNKIHLLLNFYYQIRFIIRLLVA